VLVGVLIAAGITALMLPAFLRRRKKEVLESESEEK
jgi:hypothetical protein